MNNDLNIKDIIFDIFEEYKTNEEYDRHLFLSLPFDKIELTPDMKWYKKGIRKIEGEILNILNTESNGLNYSILTYSIDLDKSVLDDYLSLSENNYAYLVSTYSEKEEKIFKYKYDPHIIFKTDMSGYEYFLIKNNNKALFYDNYMNIMESNVKINLYNSRIIYNLNLKNSDINNDIENLADMIFTFNIESLKKTKINVIGKLDFYIVFMYGDINNYRNLLEKLLKVYKNKINSSILNENAYKLSYLFKYNFIFCEEPGTTYLDVASQDWDIPYKEIPEYKQFDFFDKYGSIDIKIVDITNWI